MAMSWKKMRKNALEDAKEIRQQQAQDTRKIYDEQIFEAGRAYEDQYRENAVQKEINKRQVAESMANMGLTDSGLNRTQQTAVQLSYGNNKAAIDRAKRQSIDDIELKKTADLAAIRQGWLADKNSINRTYDKYEADYVGDLEDADAKRYEANIEAQLKAAEALEKTTYIIPQNGSALRSDMVGNLKDNNVTVTAQKNAEGYVTGYKYVDNKSGKSTVIPIGVNPFTGDDNYTKYRAVASSEKDFYNNGYQPKKVYVDGVDYGQAVDLSTTGKINGNTQKIHKTVKNGKENYWIWDSRNNEYVPVRPEHRDYIAQDGTALNFDGISVGDLEKLTKLIENSDGREAAYNFLNDLQKYSWADENTVRKVRAKYSWDPFKFYN